MMISFPSSIKASPWIHTSQTMTRQRVDRYGCYAAAVGCHRDQRQSHIIIRSLAHHRRKIFFAQPHFVFSIIVAKCSLFLYRGAESGCQSRGGVGFWSLDSVWQSGALALFDLMVLSGKSLRGGAERGITMLAHWRLQGWKLVPINLFWRLASYGVRLHDDRVCRASGNQC